MTIERIALTSLRKICETFHRVKLIGTNPVEISHVPDRRRRYRRSGQRICDSPLSPG